jgi:hypothetical protein
VKLLPVEAVDLLVARTFYLSRLHRLLRFSAAPSVLAERLRRSPTCPCTAPLWTATSAAPEIVQPATVSFSEVDRIWPSELPIEQRQQPAGVESPLRPRLESYVGVGVDVWT